jgi:hypothetical protein
MATALEHLKLATPPLGAGIVGWPWWAVAALLAASYGPTWAMQWLDVWDRVRPSRGGRGRSAHAGPALDLGPRPAEGTTRPRAPADGPFPRAE